MTGILITGARLEFRIIDWWTEEANKKVIFSTPDLLLTKFRIFVVKQKTIASSLEK